ncbi:hypothetical protein D8674_024355 [Pyrus ussuriensis x Pyrus communis]|uniref:Uncharacterized protein n=1 Tax=Pyrus ussuriensis x Pyrus communis TaxID=2448454 RepID=A0A5N5H6E2_9ROSA|nr:hypothetical protein D8674_024355 [Pyrus ussuriensis x Pyrus communis]
MYVGGKVTYIDNCDKDLMSLPVIDDMVEAVGYIERFMNYYFKIPNMDLSNGLKQIQSDSDVQSMCNFVPKDKVIEMYIEELTTEEAVTQEQQFLKSMEVAGPSKVVIEEISKKSKGKSVAEVGEGDVGEGDVGEGDTEVFFDVPIKIDIANVEQNVVDDPDYNSDALEKWNHGCTKRKAYRALDRALRIIEGKHAEQYTKLWDFAEEVKKTNPGSTVKVKLDRGRFQRIYVCLGACKEGFKSGCRPLIGLDGCHLKSLYGGQLLCAVGIDPNDETWVIAYAVVEMENKSSWIWFLELLAVDVGIVNQGGWTFISDQQKG